MSKPFFFRIDVAPLLDFATDPDGEGMTLLRFAKELQKGQSDIPFIQAIIDEAHTYINKKSIAGKKGMENRWLQNNSVITEDNTDITVLNDDITEDNTPVTSSSSSNSSNNSNNKEKEKHTPKPAVSDRWFEMFWSNYPKKVGKGAARKAWKKIKSPHTVQGQIGLALHWQKKTAEWTKDNGAYIPNPSTYLNQERWLDEPKEIPLSIREQNYQAAREFVEGD